MSQSGKRKLFMRQILCSTGIRPVKPTNRLDSAHGTDSRATYFTKPDTATPAQKANRERKMIEIGFGEPLEKYTA
jgi:hypothetical protein